MGLNCAVASGARWRPPSIGYPGDVFDTRYAPAGEVLDTGADDFMSKPPDRGELWGRLRSAERVLALQTALIRQATSNR